MTQKEVVLACKSFEFFDEIVNSLRFKAARHGLSYGDKQVEIQIKEKKNVVAFILLHGAK
ncbi:hypothetical protein [Segatella maculosa]|uniref:hypothetical protein n=1 Tax=Segatella maculosa TaxID=439703 RepID=UPI0028D8CF84|nr:hypothetical protein [Segatella maculosa]